MIKPFNVSVLKSPSSTKNQTSNTDRTKLASEIAVLKQRNYHFQEKVEQIQNQLKELQTNLAPVEKDEFKRDYFSTKIQEMKDRQVTATINSSLIKRKVLDEVIKENEHQKDVGKDGYVYIPKSNVITLPKDDETINPTFPQKIISSLWPPLS